MYAALELIVVVVMDSEVVLDEVLLFSEVEVSLVVDESVEVL